MRDGVITRHRTICQRLHRCSDSVSRRAVSFVVSVRWGSLCHDGAKVLRIANILMAVFLDSPVVVVEGVSCLTGFIELPVTGRV